MSGKQSFTSHLLFLEDYRLPHITTNGNRQKPRKSSTNTRALSTRIRNIQKEINPYIRFSGGMAMGLNKTVYIDRKTTGEFTMSSKALDVKLTDLLTMIPDGAKILSMKFSNTNGRKLTVTIPSDNPLILTGGSTAAPTQALMRRAFAPITRFPTIHVEIPDLIAANIDTADPTGAKAFSLATDGATDVVICKFHYKMAI